MGYLIIAAIGLITGYGGAYLLDADPKQMVAIFVTTWTIASFFLAIFLAAYLNKRL